MKEFFPVSHVSRADLKQKGFDADNLSDEDMEQIASFMDDNYLEDGFWSDLEEACREYGVPELNTNH
jgi:hypothetical protein